MIVTNGRTVQQETKIHNTGLDRLVQGWVVSEAVGRKKPDPEIFHAAAATVGLPLTGAWVIGDSPHADIAGADALGLRSVGGERPRLERGLLPAHPCRSRHHLRDGPRHQHHEPIGPAGVTRPGP